MLRVWLPLTKDLRNQGLDDVTVTNNGATFNSAGKLGGCYKTSSSEDIDLKYSGAQINTGSLSLCGWFKFNKAELAATWESYSFNSSYPYPTGNLIGNNNYGGVGLIWWTNSLASGAAFTSLYVACSIRSTANGARITNVVTIPFDTWVHLALIFNKSTKVLELWLNGELKVTSAMVDFNDAKTDNLKLNYKAIWGGNGPGYNIPFLVNDVRIYDHCLSPMEVKELAKGLVLHYPLNRQGWGQENLLKNSNFLQGTNGMEGYTATSATCTKQADCMKVVSTSASGGFYTSNFNSITTGDMTIFSADVKANSNMTIYIGTDGSGNGSCQAYTIGTSWQRINISKAKTTNNANLRIYGNGTFYAKNLKYELGSIATPWCPNSSDALATTMGLNSTTEYDCSGYCNNGTRTGTFSWTSDTPKYSVSTKFSANNIKDTTFNFTSNTWTAAFWYYYDTAPSAYQGFLCLSRNAGGDADKKLAAMPNSSYIWFKLEDTTLTVSSLKTKAWTHIVMTFDGTNGKVYENGVLKGTTSAASSIYTDCDDFVVGARANTTNATATTCQLVGNMSDVRIYATALSADDVKSLYQNSAYIDSSGNVYGAVHSEV